jgi:hypothetical protein
MWGIDSLFMRTPFLINVRINTRFLPLPFQMRTTSSYIVSSLRTLRNEFFPPLYSLRKCYLSRIFFKHCSCYFEQLLVTILLDLYNVHTLISVSDPCLFLTDPDPEGHLIMDPAGSASYLVIFVAIKFLH